MVGAAALAGAFGSSGALVGCASVTSPALRVGDREFDRDEIEAAIADATVEPGSDGAVPPTVDSATASAVLGDLIIDEIVDQGIEDYGVTVTDDDRAAVAAQFGLDPANISAEIADDFEFQTKIQGLRRVLGADFEQWVADSLSEVELDPRYGTFDSNAGVIPPAGPLVEGAGAGTPLDLLQG